MTTRRTRLVAAVALGLATLSTLAGLPAQAAGGTSVIRVGELERGADPGVPVVLGTTLIDGDRSIAVDTRELYLVGPAAGDAYVVTAYPDGGEGAVERLEADGTRTVLVDHTDGQFLVSDDGAHLLEAKVTGVNRTTVLVYDAVTGERVARRAFDNGISLLDASEGRAVLGAYEPGRTLWWNFLSGATRTIAKRAGYVADITADRFAVFTGDPLDGGCSRVAALSAPRTTIWRSCDQAVLDISPDGRRVISHALYLDGPIGKVQVRTVRGEVLHTYRAQGSFGSMGWETNRTVLLATYGPKRTTIARGDLDGALDRATRTIPARF